MAHLFGIHTNRPGWSQPGRPAEQRRLCASRCLWGRLDLGGLNSKVVHLASSCNLSHQSILALMFMTPDFQKGQTTKIYPQASPIRFPTTASSTTAISCDGFSIQTQATLSYTGLTRKQIFITFHWLCKNRIASRLVNTRKKMQLFIASSSVNKNPSFLSAHRLSSVWFNITNMKGASSNISLKRQ